MAVETRRTDVLPESEVFHILGNDRRRAIVQLLADHQTRVDVSDVATEIATQETDDDTVPNNLYKSVYVSLQQTHLPQLEEDDVIEYDPDAKTIQPGARFDDVYRYVDNDSADGTTVLLAHLALCLFGLVFIVLVGVGVPVISSVDPVLTSVFVFLIIAASSLYRLLAE